MSLGLIADTWGNKLSRQIWPPERDDREAHLALKLYKGRGLKDGVVMRRER